MMHKIQKSLFVLFGLQAGLTHALEEPGTAKADIYIQDQRTGLSNEHKTPISTNEIQFGQPFKTQANQTLEAVAKKLVKNSEFSTEQAINAIAAKNPETLPSQSQQLKKDVVLNLPTRDEMKLVSHALLIKKATALHDAQTHMAAFTADIEPLPGTKAEASAPKKTTSANNTKTTKKFKSTRHENPAAQTTFRENDQTEIIPSPSVVSVGELPMPDTHSELMDLVVAQNGGYSTSPLFDCHEDDRFCFSGLLDLDARYYDRWGNAGFGTQGPIDAGTLGGAGIRPLFGPSMRTFVGSINNANAFIDLRLPPYAKIHSNLAYVNGSVLLNSYTWEYGADWGSVYRLPAALKVDELYVAFMNADLLPLYIKIGRMYSDFGDYVPNTYGIKTLTPSLTQLMTQSRTGAGQIGLVLPSGFYGSLTMSYAMESLAMDNRPADLISRNGIAANKRNFSGKLGYKNRVLCDIDTNVNLSYIADMRDVDYLSDTNWFISEFSNQAVVSLYNHVMNKQGALAYHAEFYRCPFGIMFEGMYSQGKLNPGIDTPSSQWDSHVRTGGVEGKVDFKTFDHASNIKLGYQWARHSQVLAGSIFGGSPTFHQMLPKYRWQGTYTINLIEHFNAAIQWVHDHDFDEQHNGVNIGSNMAVARLDVEF